MLHHQRSANRVSLFPRFATVRGGNNTYTSSRNVSRTVEHRRGRLTRLPGCPKRAKVSSAKSIATRSRMLVNLSSFAWKLWNAASSGDTSWGCNVTAMGPGISGIDSIPARKSDSRQDLKQNRKSRFACPPSPVLVSMLTYRHGVGSMPDMQTAFTTCIFQRTFVVAERGKRISRPILYSSASRGVR